MSLGFSGGGWWDAGLLLAQMVSPLAWLWQVFVWAGLDQWLSAQDVQAAALAVLVALLWDRCFGEPPAWLHPVVAMGKLLGWAGKYIAPSVDPSRHWMHYLLGSGVWCLLGALFFVIYAVAQWLLATHVWWVNGVVMGVLLKPLLAWRMLRDEVRAVESSLQQSLPAGRERLTWLVSRDTSVLDAGAVRESAIETLAENLSDSVVAPLFWFAVAGLPGAALYRFANTADAMWGYPGWRGQGTHRRHWQWAGKWAARADDVLNWIPARVTAAMLALSAGGLSWQALRRNARVTPSPNGGWPMGAMALALGVRLGKPDVYVLHPQGEVPQAWHVEQAVRYAGRGIAMLFGLAAMSMVTMMVVTATVGLI